MRTVALLSTVLLFSALTFGQETYGHNWRGIAGYCPYGCAPYIPLLTTPSLSFATVSRNPIGATDATGGLVAGATDSTLSEVSGDTSAVFTVPVWYSGGQAPLVSTFMRGSSGMGTLPPRERFAHEGIARETSAHERWARSQRNFTPLSSEFKAERPPQSEQAINLAWVYFSSAKPTGEQPAAAPGKTPVKTLSNADVDRLNQNNGLVKYDSKTEKIQ
ncbi:MAG: hypothetical protein WCC95_20340 [Candidatus Sulfotelmatobacter sp.]